MNITLKQRAELKRKQAHRGDNMVALGAIFGVLVLIVLLWMGVV